MSFIDEELVVSIVSCGLHHAYCNIQHFVVLHVDLVVLPFTFQTHSTIHEQHKVMCVVVDFEMMFIGHTSSCAGVLQWKRWWYLGIGIIEGVCYSNIGQHSPRWVKWSIDCAAKL